MISAKAVRNHNRHTIAFEHEPINPSPRDTPKVKQARNVPEDSVSHTPVPGCHGYVIEDPRVISTMKLGAYYRQAGQTVQGAISNTKQEQRRINASFNSKDALDKMREVSQYQESKLLYSFEPLSKMSRRCGSTRASSTNLRSSSNPALCD